jgi:outer membrane protein
MRIPTRICIAIPIAFFCATILSAQTISEAPTVQPTPPISLPLPAQVVAPAPSAPMGPGPTATVTLTLQQAEQLALKNNPRISVSQLLALAQHQVYREARANLMPDLSGNLTGVDAVDSSRISSGTLTSSQLLQHAGLGVEINQLITDFGRTQNLIAASKLQERAEQANAEATREQILLATDFAFYNVLEAQATVQIADQTVATRQTTSDQIGALTKSKLKSDLDLSFANVDLSQAKLLQLDSQNQLNAAMANLTEILGSEENTDYELVDDTDATTALPPPPPDADALVALAIQQRPDLQSLHLSQQSATKFAHAQFEQLFPSVSAMGVVGKTPVGSSTYFSPDWYGAIGGNVEIPIFNGFRFTAEGSEARLRAKAAAENARDLEENITSNVRTAWLQANTSYQKVSVTEELLKEANVALNLAQTRYQLGLSSIVELSQAQLQQTEAAIDDANARYQYQFSLAALRYQTGEHP